MAEINFVRTDGNLGRLPASEDATSGILVMSHVDNLPTTIELVVTSYKDYLAKKEEWENDNDPYFSTDAQNNAVGYHIQQFFVQQPSATLYLRFSAAAAGVDYMSEDIVRIQNFAQGQIRQLGVLFLPNATNELGDGTNDLTLSATTTSSYTPYFTAPIQALRAENKPLHVLFAFPTKLVSTLSSLINARTNDQGVSVVIGGVENEHVSVFNTAAALGAALGTLSRAAVHENIGWVEKFNIGLQSPVLFINDAFIKVSELSETDLQTLTTKGYIFLRKYNGRSGTYWNDSPTCQEITSDFAYIENNRTLDKAIRQTYILLLPSLNSPVYLNADGTLTAKDISRLSVTARKALEQMQRDGEVSNFSIFIDPNQNILATSEIEIEMSVQPVGVARQLKVKIGFAANVA